MERPTALQVVDGVELTGKTCVITGASSTRTSTVDVRRDFLTPDQGAATRVWAAVSPDLSGVGAVYLADCQVRDDVAPSAVDEQRAARVWELSESLCTEEGES